MTAEAAAIPTHLPGLLGRPVDYLPGIAAARLPLAQGALTIFPSSTSIV
jgi:hypothetical protein